MKTKKLSVFFLIGLFLLMLFSPETVATGAANGLLLWYRQVLPVLFPFLLITGLMIRTESISLINHTLSPILKPFLGISENASFSVVCGFLCGFPVGAKSCSDLTDKGKISSAEGEYLLSFCNNVSPAFLTGLAKTLPIVKDDELVGVVSTGDIAKSYMDVYDSEILSKARTQYRNIVKTLDGTMITGNEHGYFMRGKVAIGASSPNLMEEFIEKDDLVILGDLEEAQACAGNIDASCMVICKDAEVSPKLIQKAKEQSIVIIQTPYDTFTTARLINQSIPVKFYMTSGPLTMFRMNDYVDDIKDIMAKKRFRDFPILDRHGRFKGFISRRRFLGASKKKVILVDHNERSQAVDGIEEAEIIEIIDHHRLGDIETVSPITFRNQPVGCTATIINQMYEENEIEVPREIAGILLSKWKMVNQLL